MATYYVYLMTNRTRRLYIGFTNHLHRRVYEHEHRLVPGFASKYFLEHLAYFEHSDDVGAAIGREKELKGWRRSKKIALIQTVNPRSDLSRDLIGCKGRGEPGPIAARRSLTHTPNSTPLRSG